MPLANKPQQRTAQAPPLSGKDVGSAGSDSLDSGYCCRGRRRIVPLSRPKTDTRMLL